MWHHFNNYIFALLPMLSFSHRFSHYSLCYYPHHPNFTVLFHCHFFYSSCLLGLLEMISFPQFSKMGFYHHRLNLISLSLLFLITASSIQFQLGYLAEGRKILKKNGFQQRVGDEKMMLRAQIGSRPPRCERRCSSCAHCEAIRVPTNPQLRSAKNHSSSTVFSVAYARRADSSNYMPMSWKCKCGNIIFNP